MTHLPTRAQQLIDAGRLPVPGRGLALLTDREDPRQRYTADDFNHPRATDVQIRLGLQPSGRYLYMADLDSHTSGQDADAARAGFERIYPQIARKLDWKRSRSGTGWHAFFESTTKLDTGKLYDLNGQHIGELLGGDADRTLDPGDLNPGWLSKTETDQIRSAWLVRGCAPGGARWSERAQEGKRWAAGYQHQRVTRQMLKDFLLALDTNTSRSLAQKLTTATVGERSDLAGHLMQCLMFNAHKLPCGWNADFRAKCRMVMAYWMAADSFGKAAEKDYSQEKDGWSLITQIVHEDAHLNGGKWTCPFWAKSPAPRVPAPEPEPEPKRPAHRPAGDQAKQIARLRRVLEAIEPDDFGRRVYTLDYLAERCGARPRTIQVYLKILRDGSEIATGQIGGNGRPYAVLTACFGGADKSAKPDKPSAPAPDIWGADATPTERVETPKSTESPPQCIGDHQNGRAPAASHATVMSATAGAAPSPVHQAARPDPADEWAGIDEAIEEWKRTTRDGRHFAKLERRYAETREQIAGMRHIIRPGERERLSQLRALARQVNEPGWYNRDYDAMDIVAIDHEIRRLTVLAAGAAPAGAQGLGDPLSRTGCAWALPAATLGG